MRDMSWEEEFGDWRHFLFTCKEIGYHPLNPHIRNEGDIAVAVQWINPNVEWFLVQLPWPHARKALETILDGVHNFKPWTVFITPDHLGVIMAFSRDRDYVTFRLAAP